MLPGARAPMPSANPLMSFPNPVAEVAPGMMAVPQVMPGPAVAAAALMPEGAAGAPLAVLQPDVPATLPPSVAAIAASNNTPDNSDAGFFLWLFKH